MHAAAAAAHRELGREYDSAVAESLIDRIGAEIDKRIDTRLGARSSGSRSPAEIWQWSRSQATAEYERVVAWLVSLAQAARSATYACFPQRCAHRPQLASTACHLTSIKLVRTVCYLKSARVSRRSGGSPALAAPNGRTSQCDDRPGAVDRLAVLAGVVIVACVVASQRPDAVPEGCSLRSGWPVSSRCDCRAGRELPGGRGRWCSSRASRAERQGLVHKSAPANIRKPAAHSTTIELTPTR